MSCRLNLLFDNKIVKHWEVDVDQLLQKRKDPDEWFEHLAGTAHYLAVHNCPRSLLVNDSLIIAENC